MLNSTVLYVPLLSGTVQQSTLFTALPLESKTVKLLTAVPCVIDPSDTRTL